MAIGPDQRGPRAHPCAHAGRDLYAFRYAANDKANTLYYRASGDDVLVASEPLDRERDSWTPVPDNTVLAARAGRPLEIAPLLER